MMQIANIVLSGRFSQSINLHSLPGCTYKPEKFSGGIYKHGGCTFLLFANGSFVCLGAKDEIEATDAINSLASCLRLNVETCAIKNMVMSHNLNYDVNLSMLYRYLQLMVGCVIWEEELFSGITWKQNGATIRLFHNGKFFVTGLTSSVELQLACEKISEICNQFRK